MGTKIVPRGKRLGAVSAARIAAQERQLQAAVLRTQGATYREIALSLGYANSASALKAVRRCLERQSWDLARDVIQMDLNRLDRYQMIAEDRLRAGDLSQIDRLLRIMGERRGLTGVSQRTVEEISSGVSVHVADGGQINIVPPQLSQQDFVAMMMAAAGIDPTSVEGKKYLTTVSREDRGEAKELPSGKKVRIVRRKKKEVSAAERSQAEQHALGIETSPYSALGEDEVVDAEIVEP